MANSSHHSGLAAIAVFKLMKGALLGTAGFGLLTLMHADIATWFSILLEALHLNADSRLIHSLVMKVDQLQPHSVLIAGIVSLSYAGLLLLEGIGLWLEWSWAAYLTVVSTSLLLPLEVYEIFERLTVLRISVLIVNVAIVLYLIHHLRRHHLSLPKHRPPQAIRSCK